ncbi:hypothetical protein [Arsukibacterium sp.]|uniref:hypothetical protein n=1 Tax=Arsukibacterium sp. TaxID=1977258 RepID=UPI001BD4FA02|nr:hypothetical protein [Arsukibacterium sp.]
MNLGEWDSAVFKSVSIPAILVLLYAVYETGLPLDLDSIAGLGTFAMLFIGVYLAISLVGWLIIGFPVHWLICVGQQWRLVYVCCCRYPIFWSTILGFWGS